MRRATVRRLVLKRPVDPAAKMFWAFACRHCLRRHFQWLSLKLLSEEAVPKERVLQFLAHLWRLNAHCRVNVLPLLLVAPILQMLVVLCQLASSRHRQHLKECSTVCAEQRPTSYVCTFRFRLHIKFFFDSERFSEYDVAAKRFNFQSQNFSRFLFCQKTLFLDFFDLNF